MSFLPDLVSAEKEDYRASKKLRPAEQTSHPQAAFTTRLKTSPVLGLNLNKSSLRLIETKLNEQMKRKEVHSNANRGNETAMTNNAVSYNNSPRQRAEKLKASNFQVQKIVIGTWERRSVYQDDLVAKCYFAKKKLVWEILEKGLKSKIEISWSDILAMAAEVKDNQPGILKVELGRQPSFYHEIDPQPRKHTQWKLTSDFTNGQASINRRHFLYFEPGVLEKQYEKLVQYDNELTERSRTRFPTLISAHFGTRERNFSYYPFCARPEVIRRPSFPCCVDQQMSIAPAVPSLQFGSTPSQGVKQGYYPVAGFNQNYATNSTQFQKMSPVVDRWDRDCKTNSQPPHTYHQGVSENLTAVLSNSLEQNASYVQDGNPNFSNAYNPMQENLLQPNAGWIHNVPDQLITTPLENSFGSDEGRVQDGDFNFSREERNRYANSDTTGHRPAIREIANKLFDDSKLEAELDVLRAKPAIVTPWERELMNGYPYVPQNADEANYDLGVGNSTGFPARDQFKDVDWIQQNLGDFRRGQFQ